MMISSTMPSQKYSCSVSPDMFWNGRAAIHDLSRKAGGVEPVGVVAVPPMPSSSPCKYRHRSAEQIRSLLITAQSGIGDARRSGINGDRSGTALIHPGEPFGLRLDNGRKGATAPVPASRAKCPLPFAKETFGGTRGNERDAPEADMILGPLRPEALDKISVACRAGSGA
jgi:hypothetical protein